MKAVSGSITLNINAGYFADYEIRKKSSFQIEETNLEDLRLTFRLLESSKSSKEHPDIELRAHYYMVDGEVKQQTSKINAFGSEEKSISYIPPGNLNGRVKAVGFSCDLSNLTFIIRAFDKSKPEGENI